MQGLIIPPEQNTPGIRFSPVDNIYLISGNSAPEDVRALYYPVIEWFSMFATEISVRPGMFTPEKPLTLKIDLKYFNSSSAKFIYDLILQLKSIGNTGVPVALEWYYDKDDNDMMEAGKDISSIVEMDFRYIENQD
jgi:hypothetical protein